MEPGHDWNPEWIAVRTVTDGAAPLRLVELRPPGEAQDPFGSWVTPGAVALVERLRQALHEDAAERCAVLVQTPRGDEPPRRAAAEALLAAVRGIVGSLTLELRERTRVNAIFADDLEGAGVQQTVAFLAGTHAGFVAGATFDLREAR